MKCPACSSALTKVIDSRPNADDSAVRRRRVCDRCDHRFSTYEILATLVAEDIEKRRIMIEDYIASLPRTPNAKQLKLRPRQE